MALDYTKKQKAEIRRLNGLAWERELATALDELRRELDLLKDREMSAFDLADSVHHFHDHTARNLYKCYSDGRNFFAVPSAIVRGIIQRSEVSSEVLELLEPVLRDLSE